MPTQSVCKASQRLGTDFCRAIEQKRSAWLVQRIQERGGFDFVFAAQDFRASQFSGIDFEGAEHNWEAEVHGALTFIAQNQSRPPSFSISPPG